MNGVVSLLIWLNSERDSGQELFSPGFFVKAEFGGLDGGSWQEVNRAAGFDVNLFVFRRLEESDFDVVFPSDHGVVQVFTQQIVASGGS